MKVKRNLILFLVFALVILLSTSCSAGQPAAPAPTTQPEPAEEEAGEQEAIFQAVLEDGVCTFSGPETVAPGYTTVAFDNGGDRNLGAWANQYLEGKTHADFLAEIFLGPEEAHAKPDWVKYPNYSTRDYRVWTINLPEPGEYGLFVGGYSPYLEYPCGAIQVVESNSD